MPNPSTYFAGRFSSLAAKACIIDTSLPTFAGIASATFQLDGSAVVTWAAATSTKTPVRYEIYVSLGSVSAAALFVTANRVAFAPGALTAWRIFVLRDQVTYFMPGQVYTFGIRAVDSQNFADSNTVILTATALYPNYGSLASAVWDQLQSAHTIPGSFGVQALSNTVWTNARAGFLDFLDATISSRAPASTALSTVQWTNARAALLDFLDVSISSRAPAATALSNATWTNARAALLDFLDAFISSRAAAATALSTAQWTNVRAALLDNLDVAISTRLASASYTAPDNASISAIKAKTDNLPADPASNTQVNTRAPAATALDNTVWTNTKAGFVDVAISSRLAAASYIAPDNADITAIKAKTDNLPADPASNTQVNTRVSTTHFDTILGTPVTSISGDIAAIKADTALIAAIKTVTDKFLFDGSNFVKANAQVVADKTGYDLLSGTVQAIAGAVWDQLLVSHNTAGTFGANAQNPPLSPSAVAAAVWNALIASYNTPGTFGNTLQNPSISPTQVAQAVWDALLVNHTAAGSFGLNAQTPSLNPTQVAQAVWNALASLYNVSGTMGELLNSAGAPSSTVGVKVLTAKLIIPDTLVAKVVTPNNLEARILE